MIGTGTEARRGLAEEGADSRALSKVEAMQVGEQLQTGDEGGRGMKRHSKDQAMSSTFFVPVALQSSSGLRDGHGS